MFRKKEKNLISDNIEETEIANWLLNVKFKKKLFGGVDEIDVWNKINELNDLYEKLLISKIQK